MTRKGVWDLQDLRDKELVGEWSNDGLLFAWGYNAGALGQNNGVHYSSPIQIPGTKWLVSSTGKGPTAGAVRDDGTLWMWGYNGEGQLGQNQNEDAKRSSPIQIPGTNWSGVKITEERVIATKSDGTMWGWGNNGAGALGQNNETKYSSPVQIPGTTWSDEFATGLYHTLAIKTDGTLWTWGNGYNGDLGNGTSGSNAHRSSPVQVPGTTWSEIGGGDKEMIAIKTDGTMWAWGSNTYGGLGQNSRTNYSSPKQIPGTNWTLTSGGLVNLALKEI